jgi:hypothetical protein
MRAALEGPGHFCALKAPVGKKIGQAAKDFAHPARLTLHDGQGRRGDK